MSEDLHEKIKELESKIRDLEQQLIHDKLTKVKTRDYFEKESKNYLNTAGKIQQGKRREWMGFRDISFLFFDIDHFKKVNDTYGHSVGDTVLKEVAKTIRGNLRVGDIVARWGGEEFVAILLGANESESKMKAEELRRKIEEIQFGNKNLKITISIGVAGFSPEISFEDLVKNSDLALYKAKRTGRNKVIAFSETK